MKKTKLASLLKENKKQIKQPINEGLFTKAIAGILQIIYSGKVKQIMKDLEPVNADLAKTVLHLKQSVDDFNKHITDPETIELFKKYGVDITDLPKLKR